LLIGLLLKSSLHVSQIVHLPAQLASQETPDN
jgi:hypothetical protein